MKHHIIYIVLISLVFLSCSNMIEPDEPNALVPATVEQNSDLPGLSIHVADFDRLVHYRTFDDAAECCS